MMRTALRRFGAAVLALAGAAAVLPLRGQDVAGPYADETAHRLHEVAVEAHLRAEDAIVSYTAVVRQRVGASLRMPLKDRTLYRLESSHRVLWTRDGETLVQPLALREQTPLGVREGQTHSGLFDTSFDPVNDRLFFGFSEPEDNMEPDPDDFWFEHPLAPTYTDRYRFTVGDTLTLSLPDGRRVLAVELQVVPQEADVHRMTGSLWIEPESGALVRAVYRLSDTFDAFRDIPDLQEEEDEDLKYVPGLLKPWTMELTLIAVDYTLWDFELWLPRSMRAEGVVTAGILTAPAVMDVSYEMEEVLTEADLAGVDGQEPVYRGSRSEAMAMLETWDAPEGTGEYGLEPGWTRQRDSRGRRMVRYLVPEDPEVLLTSSELPPPVWEDAPGFASQAELERLFDGLADLPEARLQHMPRTFRWGLQSPDLVRFNRVEALSVGARGMIRPHTAVGPVTVTLEGRLGMADRIPNARLSVSRETLHRRWTVRAYHELAAVDERARHLGIGNSLFAAFFGRDDGEYFRRSGATVELSPPSSQRPTYTLSAFAEYHRGAEAGTSFALNHLRSDSWTYRPNLWATAGWETGGQITLSPWWGTDPRLVQGGVDFVARASTGDFEYARTSLTGRLAIPLPDDFRVGLEAGGGTSWGSPPIQRIWLLGGAGSLRGYAPRTQEGTSYLRARGEVAKRFAFGAVSVFSDLGWAGDRDLFTEDDALVSAGVGLSLVDGLIRMDAGWGLRKPRGFRFDLYLDAIL